MATNINFSKRLGIPNGTNIILSTSTVGCSDLDADAFLLATGITDPIISAAICNLVVGLKTDGLWSQMTAIYPFVGGTATTHKYNLKDPRDLNAAYRLTFYGGWRHDSQGILGNGTNTYADTYFAGNVQTVGIYTPADYNSNFSFGYNEDYSYCDTDGCYTNIGQQLILSTFNGQFSCCNWPESVPAYFGQGHSQVGARSTTQYGYRNGIKVATNTLGGGPIFFRDTMVVGGRRFLSYDSDTGSITSSYISDFTSCIHSFAYFSTVELDDTETANLYARIQTFQIALGRGVVTLNVSDPDAFAFLSNALIVDPIYSTTQGNAVNNLVVDLKTNSLWSKMRDVWPFISDSRNLMDYSEDFTNALWLKTGVAVTGNTIAAPNNSLTADTIAANGVASVHQVVQTRSIIAGNTYTISVYARANTNNFIQLLGTSPIFGGNFWANFNLSAGTVGSFGAATTASIQNAGGGWYRCIITGIATGTATGNISILLVTSATATRAESNSLNTSVFLWGSQIDLGSTATTYQANFGTYANRISSQFTGNVIQRFRNDNARILFFANTWTFSLTGATGNGTNAYAQTGSNLSNYLSAGNAHISAYSRTAITPAANRTLFGASTTAPNNGAAFLTFTSTPFNVNTGMGGTGTITGAPFTSTKGLLMTSSTAVNSLKTYQDGVLKGFQPTGGVMPSTQLNFNAFYNGATFTRSNYAPFELAFATIGTGLTDAEAATLNSIVTTYQTALSRNV
jgi:hypothetical protein